MRLTEIQFLERILDKVLQRSWEKTFGASATPGMAGAKRDLLQAAALALREELLQLPPVVRDAAKTDECGVVGYPQGERKVCRRALGHEREGVEYHKDGSVQWLGYFTPLAPTLDESEDRTLYGMRSEAARAGLTKAFGAVARSADSQAEQSTRGPKEEETREITRPNWWRFRNASAYDAVILRYFQLHQLGALSREEAALGAALELSVLLHRTERPAQG